jgi:uncharacterized membrane protein YgcG
MALAATLAATLHVAPASAQPLSGDGTLTCGSSYTVAGGDTLSLIARRAYGDPQLYGFIADANWDAIGGNPENIRVGMALTIPCVDSTGRVLTADEAAAQAGSLAAAMAAVGPLAADQLDTLFGPVALFPDAVLSRLLVAVTFPLDVVKAGRFIAERADLPDSQRAAEARAEPWDPSVQELAAAFPDVVTRMNDHIDWTEQAGEAVLAQTDDVLDAIQRLRAKAQENGYLVDNEAQEVETVNDTIVINPAQEGVVYVPTYQSEVVYSAPLSGPPVYYYDDWHGGWDDVLIAGGIILGGAILLDELFEDDWDGWNDWKDDIDLDWDRGDITIDRGDINIDRDEINIGSGDRLNIGDGQLGDGQRGQIGDGQRGQIGDGPLGDGAGRDRSDRVSIGDVERPEIARPPRAETRPAAGDRQSVGSAASRDAARAKIESRQAAGGGVAALPATRPAATRPSASRPSAGSRPSVSAPVSASNRSPAASRSSNISRPTTTRQPTARAPSRSNSFDRSSGGSRASAASSRGRSSASRGGGGRSGGGGGGRRR